MSIFSPGSKNTIAKHYKFSCPRNSDFNFLFLAESINLLISLTLGNDYSASNILKSCTRVCPSKSRAITKLAIAQLKGTVLLFWQTKQKQVLILHSLLNHKPNQALAALGATAPLLTRFDSRITLTGPTQISITPQKGSAPSSYFLHLEKQAQVPGPHPGDHSHRPPPGWVGGNNKHTLQVSMHTSSTNLAAAISTSSTGTINILHKRNLSTQHLPCQSNTNTLHPRTRPLREKGCLCPSPTKPKTTTHNKLSQLAMNQKHSASSFAKGGQSFCGSGRR